jgi:hypothetical protein
MADFIKGDPNKNLIPVFLPDTAQKPTVVQAGPGIVVTDLSDINAYRFEVELADVTALVATLGLTAKAATVVKTNPVLKGTVIDEVIMTFAYNKVIASQTLTNNGGLTPPVLDFDDTDYTYTGETIDEDISFTLTGNDGEGLPGSIDTDIKSIQFGNYMFLGAGASKINSATSSIEAFIEALATQTIKTARAHTYFATGGVNQKHFVAYPKAWGLATFTKGIFAGGYVRLKNIAGTLLTEGTPETDIMITNSLGHEEAYYVYESLYDNQNDPTTPFIIS